MPQSSKTIQVFLFNVGQGDHILIRLPDGSYGVIDFYYSRDYNPLGESPGLTYLKQLHKDGEEVKITFLHLSHYHQDHFKGIGQWLLWIKQNGIPLSNLWLPGVSSPESLYERICKWLSDEEQLRAFISEAPGQRANYVEEFKIKFCKKSPLSTLENFKECFKDCTVDYLIGFKELFPYRKPVDIAFYCLTPSSRRIANFNKQSLNEIAGFVIPPKKELEDEEKKNEEYIDQNDISVVIQVKLRDICLLFGGDATRKNLEECIASYTPARERKWGTLESDFIKVFHHGSRNSSSVQIWDAFLKSKDDVTLGVSAGTTFSHPHQETLDEILEVCKKKSTTNHIFSTNIYNLKDTRKLECLENTDEPFHLPWKNKNKLTKKCKRKKDRRLDYLSPKHNESVYEENKRLNEQSQNLGYFFEFFPDGQDTIVKKMVSTGV